MATGNSSRKAAIARTRSRNHGAPGSARIARHVDEPAPAGLSPKEKTAWDQLDFFYKKGLGYANEMGLRPQTRYGLADSPIGLAACMLDNDARSHDMIARVFDGQHEGLTRDDILDNVTLYWLMRSMRHRVAGQSAYPKMIYYSYNDKGTHFAAGEQPELLNEDLRAGFRSLRENLVGETKS